MKHLASKLSNETLDALKKLGWDFVPIGPNEYNWIKFNHPAGDVIAQGGDPTWSRDLVEVVLAQTAEAEKPSGVKEVWVASREFRWTHPTENGFHAFPTLQQKWLRVSNGPPCGGGSSKWIDVPSVDSNGKPM